MAEQPSFDAFPTIARVIKEAVASTLDYYAARLLFTAMQLLIRSTLYRRYATILRGDLEDMADAENELKNAQTGYREARRTLELLQSYNAHRKWELLGNEDQHIYTLLLDEVMRLTNPGRPASRDLSKGDRGRRRRQS